MIPKGKTPNGKSNLASNPLTELRKLQKRHAKWLEFIDMFSYVIKYKKGEEFDLRINPFEEGKND
ncbi:hypothetical protein CR513_22482, partial [Mucuna pruriens]